MVPENAFNIVFPVPYPPEHLPPEKPIWPPSTTHCSFCNEPLYLNLEHGPENAVEDDYTRHYLYHLHTKPKLHLNFSCKPDGWTFGQNGEAADGRLFGPDNPTAEVRTISPDEETGITHFGNIDGRLP